MLPVAPPQNPPTAAEQDFAEARRCLQRAAAQSPALSLKHQLRRASTDVFAIRHDGAAEQRARARLEDFRRSRLIGHSLNHQGGFGLWSDGAVYGGIVGAALACRLITATHTTVWQWTQGTWAWTGAPRNLLYRTVPGSSSVTNAVEAVRSSQAARQTKTWILHGRDVGVLIGCSVGLLAGALAGILWRTLVMVPLVFDNKKTGYIAATHEGLAHALASAHEVVSVGDTLQRLAHTFVDRWQEAISSPRLQLHPEQIQAEFKQLFETCAPEYLREIREYALAQNAAYFLRCIQANVTLIGAPDDAPQATERTADAPIRNPSSATALRALLPHNQTDRNADLDQLTQAFQTWRSFRLASAEQDENRYTARRALFDNCGGSSGILHPSLRLPLARSDKTDSEEFSSFKRLDDACLNFLRSLMDDTLPTEEIAQRADTLSVAAKEYKTLSSL